MADATALAPLRLGAREAELVQAAADMLGMSRAEWVRAAVRAALLRQALESPELRRRMDEALGPHQSSRTPAPR